MPPEIHEICADERPMTQEEEDLWADETAARLREAAENSEGIESSNGGGLYW